MKIQARLKGAVAPIALSIALVGSPAFAQDDVDTEAEASEEEEDSAPIIVTGSRIARDEFSSPAPITVVDPEIAVKQGLMDTGEMIQGSPIASGSSQVTAALSSQYVTNGGQGAQTVSLRGLGAERTLVLLNGRRAGPAGTQGAVSSFDLNVLPQSIVQRVDILKDGASSIYGSDAVAGVVNLITKTDTDGIEVDLFGSGTVHGGGEQYSISATYGKTFDRGHILIAGNFNRQNELERGHRKYLGCPEAYFFTDTTYTERADLVDPRTGKIACANGDSDTTWGHIWTYDYSYYYSPHGSNLPPDPSGSNIYLLQYSYPGDNLGQYLNDIPDPIDPFQLSIPDGWYPVGYDPVSQSVQNNYHPLMNDDTVFPALERYSAYLDAAYEVAYGLELYTELLYNKRITEYDATGQVWQFGLGEDGQGLFGLPGGDPLANGFSGSALYSPTAFIDWYDSRQEVDYYRGVLGLRGGITGSWGFDVYGQYSRSDGDYTDQRVLQDAIDTQDFRGVFTDAPCAGNITPVSNRPCVDVDWYSPRVMYGDFNQAEMDFLTDTETGNTKYTQWYVEGIVNGELFELPGGTVGVAVGGNYRVDEINDTPGHVSLAENVWGGSTSGITAGKTQTLEGFGEINLPLLADIPGIQRLELSAAARITNVKATRASDGFTDEDNGNWTYRFTGDWAVTDWLRFRGTYGTSFRAPALFEQFLANQVSFIDQRSIDPCIGWQNALDDGAISQQFAANCAADGVPGDHTGAGIEATIYTGGGIGALEPETSTAWTASAILTPYFDFLPDTEFSVAVDYFDIEVKGEIASLGALTTVSSCYASDFFPTDPLCSLFARNDDLSPSDPDWNSGSPSNIARARSSFVNINSQQNRGVDVTTRIVHDFGGDTTLSLQGQMTWQTKDVVALFEGTDEDNNGEAGEPIFVGDFRMTLDHGPWSFFYGVDVIGGTDDRRDYLDQNFGTSVPIDTPICRDFTVYPDTVCIKLTTEATFYHSISITREFGENLRVTGGVSNLFNTSPPRVSNTGGNGIQDFGQGVLYSQYDLLGIRGFLNINVKY